MRTNETFGDIYKESDDEDSERVSKVNLSEPKRLNSVNKSSISNDLYTDVKKTIEKEVERGSDPSGPYQANLQVMLTEKALKYGDNVLDELKASLKSDFAEDAVKRSKVDALIAGVESVCEYVTNRRKQLDKSEIVDSYELSCNVTLDAKDGVDVVERMLLQNPKDGESGEERYVDQIHLVQIKTSEDGSGDDQGPDEYYEDHRDLVVQDMKGKDYLLGSLLKKEGKKGLELKNKGELSELLEPGIENQSELISKLMVDTLDQLSKVNAERGKINDKDIEEFMHNLFVSMFGKEDQMQGSQPEHLDDSEGDQLDGDLEHQRYFKRFCALIKSGSFRPSKIFESALNPHINFPAATKERKAVMESIVDDLRRKEKELEDLFAVKDYVVFSGYYVKNSDNPRKQRKIVDSRGNEVSIQALRIKQNKFSDLYDRYGLPKS